MGTNTFVLFCKTSFQLQYVACFTRITWSGVYVRRCQDKFFEYTLVFCFTMISYVSSDMQPESSWNSSISDSRSLQHLCELEGYKIMSIFPGHSSKSPTLFNNEQFSGNVQFRFINIETFTILLRSKIPQSFFDTNFFYLLGWSLFDLLFDWICHEQ